MYMKLDAHEAGCSYVCVKVCLWALYKYEQSTAECKSPKEDQFRHDYTCHLPAAPWGVLHLLQAPVW